jgi:hypothetical protein
MRKVILALITSAVSLVSIAQSNLTLYNMEPLPQRMQVNPALSPDCKWYLGMPGISSLDFSFNSNVISLGDINKSLELKPNGTSYALNLGTLSSVLDRSTFVNVSVSQDWINFGFRVRKSMFTANITEKVKTRISIPNDIFKLAFEGNGGENLGYDFNFNFGLDVIQTREFAIGYNRSLLDDKLKVGGKLKYIRGLNVISTHKNDVVFTTNPDDFSYNVKADIEINASAPLLDEETDPLVALLGSPRNSGFGIDLGASYDLNEKITLSASVIDLGRVFWKENTTNIKSKNPGATFKYRGIDIKEYLGNSSSGSEGFDALADTLLDIFALDTTQKSFSTGLLGEFYLGGNLKITDRHNAGVLFYGSFYNKQFYPAATLSWNSEFGRILALSASYTIMRGSYANLGMGFALNMGPEQLYFVSDNLIGALTGNVKNLSLRFGWNHTFGRKKWEQKQQKVQEAN